MFLIFSVLIYLFKCCFDKKFNDTVSEIRAEEYHLIPKRRDESTTLPHILENEIMDIINTRIPLKKNHEKEDLLEIPIHPRPRSHSHDSSISVNINFTNN